MTIRVAVIDADTLTRYGLRELVAQQPDIEIAAECCSAAQAPGLVATVFPDVVTVDVTLPDGDGLRLARDLRDRYADLGIVMLTSQGEDDVLFRALETGASAFVAKTAPVEEVLAAIRHAAVAATCFSAAGLATALARRRTAEAGLALSQREKETLTLLRDGLSIPAIAQVLYVSHSTAKTYVARLYRKLGAANRTQALMAAMHLGLIRYEQPGSLAGAQAAAGSVALGPAQGWRTAGRCARIRRNAAGSDHGQGARPRRRARGRRGLLARGVLVVAGRDGLAAARRGGQVIPLAVR